MYAGFAFAPREAPAPICGSSGVSLMSPGEVVHTLMHTLEAVRHFGLADGR